MLATGMECAEKPADRQAGTEETLPLGSLFRPLPPAAERGSVTQGGRSLEVRWFFPGQLDTAVAGWFGRFPAETQSREDTYLLDPQLRGLSVKVRGGLALEVKAYRGSPGFSICRDAPAGAWSPGRSGPFPLPRSARATVTRPGWRAVRKRRRISRFSSASPVATQAPAGPEPWCAVELTEVHISGQDWWTLGFEATGPDDLLGGALQATAAIVFAQALPGRVAPGPVESRSYLGWLRQQPGAER